MKYDNPNQDTNHADSEAPVPADNGADDSEAIPTLEEAVDFRDEAEAELSAWNAAESAPQSESDQSDSDNDANAQSQSRDAARPAPDEDGAEMDIYLGYEYDTADRQEDMEEIQTLMMSDSIDDSADQPQQSAQEDNIALLEAIVFESEDPIAPAPRQATDANTEAQPDADLNPAKPTPGTPEQTLHERDAPTETSAPQHISGQNSAAPLAPPPPIFNPAPITTKGDNPFLPKHILDRLNDGRRNLVEEIAQSGAALDASTAMLRSRAQADRIKRNRQVENQDPHTQSRNDKAAFQNHRLVDNLVEEYLPIIATELRRRLKRMLDE